MQRLSSHVDGPQFDITQYIVSCTLDVICGELLSVSYTARALGCVDQLYFAH